MSNQFSKQSVENSFATHLIEGLNWSADKKIEWAKIKTFDLTKETILFDLGILAFLGTTSPLYNCKIWLYLGAGFTLVSLLLAFIYIWKISAENIDLLQAKFDVMKESIVKLNNSYDEALTYYNEKMETVDRRLREKEEKWDKIQKMSFILFFLGVIVSFIGLVFSFLRN